MDCQPLITMDDQTEVAQVGYDIVTLQSMACMIRDRIEKILECQPSRNTETCLSIACFIIERSVDLQNYYEIATRTKHPH